MFELCMCLKRLMNKHYFQSIKFVFLIKEKKINFVYT
jgi:hypothetical protein